MTQREFYTAVANTSVEGELVAYAQAQLEKMDAANEKRKNTPSKKATENAPLVDQIVNEILGAEAVTAADVAAILGCSVQKASMLCRAAVLDGRAIATDVKVPKKGTLKGYTKA